MKTIIFVLGGALAMMALGIGFAAEKELTMGVAKVDITPDYPVRLNGFGFRRVESEGVRERIFAKALAFGDEKEGPAVLITVDNLCVSMEILQEVGRQLKARVGVKPERLTMTATHTHTAPMLKGVAPTLFSLPIPAEHQANIDRYTKEFIGKAVEAGAAAVKDLRPARVTWGIGNVGFAANRRTKGGPVDHDLPVMVVTDLDGKTRAVYFSYACHCVTLSDNRISGDWAGYAQAAVEKLYPGAMALASVGCGADSNPSSGVTGDKGEICKDQGEQVATEVKRLIGSLKPLTARPEVRTAPIEIPYNTPRTRAEWEERATNKDQAIAFHSKGNLARLDRGEKLPTSMPYLIQTWIFGDELAMIFMPGETVVDYSLRLKKELDRNRIWVNGYSNEGRCYVPSERILQEGGYEGGGAMVYYDQPNRFGPGLEDKIIGVVRELVPKGFVAEK